MFLAIITSKVRKELEIIGFNDYQGIEFVKLKQGIYFFRVLKGNTFYMIRYYEEGKADLIANDYKRLENIGINVVEITAFSKYIIVTNDFEENGSFLRLNNVDFVDEDMVRKLADLCKSLFVYNENGFNNLNEYFSVGTIGVISKKMNIKNNKVFNYILENFDNIISKFDRLDKSIVFLGISRENLIFNKQTNSIFIDVVDEVFVGYRYMSVVMFLNMLDSDLKSAFLNECSVVKEEEILLNELMSCIFNLYRVCKGEKITDFTNKCLEKLNSDDMLDVVRNIVEWH